MGSAPQNFDARHPGSWCMCKRVAPKVEREKVSLAEVGGDEGVL